MSRCEGRMLAASAGIQPVRPFGLPGTLILYHVGFPVSGSTGCERTSTTCGRNSERNSLSTVTRRAVFRGAERTVTVQLRWPEPTTSTPFATVPESAACAPGPKTESASSATARRKLARDRRLERTDHTDSSRTAYDPLRHGNRDDACLARLHDDARNALRVRPGALGDAGALDDDLSALGRLSVRCHANHNGGALPDGQGLRRRREGVADDLLRLAWYRSHDDRLLGVPVVGGIRLGLLAHDGCRVRERARLVRRHDQRDRHRLTLGDRAEVAVDDRAAGAAPLRGRHRDEGRAGR